MRLLLRELNTTAVIVSHDLRDAVAIADDLVVLEAGRVLQAAPLRELLARPGSATVAGMVGGVSGSSPDRPVDPVTTFGLTAAQAEYAAWVRSVAAEFFFDPLVRPGHVCMVTLG